MRSVSQPPFVICDLSVLAQLYDQLRAEDRSSPDGKSTLGSRISTMNEGDRNAVDRGEDELLLGVHDPPVTETFETCRPEISDRGIYFDRYTADTLGPHRGKLPVINLSSGEHGGLVAFKRIY